MSTLDPLAHSLTAAFGHGAITTRPSAQIPDFTLEAAYTTAHLVRDLRRARGEHPVGRKIGGTNPAVYHLTGATGPVWGFVYDTTLVPSGRFDTKPFPQLRIEPEFVLRLSAPIPAGADEDRILDAIGAVALGFEFVFSPYDNWQLKPADAVATYCLHAGLAIGPWHDITANRAPWRDHLRTGHVEMRSSTGACREGQGRNVLGSPLLALKAIADDIATHPDWQQLAPGELITTGTTTELLPAAAGETWTITTPDLPLAPLTVECI